MALEERVTYDYTISEDGTITARRITRIVKDGRVVATDYHKFVILPGMSVEDAGCDVGDTTVRTLVSSVHTQELVESYKKKMVN